MWWIGVLLVANGALRHGQVLQWGHGVQGVAKLLAHLPVCDTREGVFIGRVGGGGLGSWLRTAPATWTGIAVGTRRAKLLARLPVCDTGQGVFIGRVGGGGLGSWLRTGPATWTGTVVGTQRAAAWQSCWRACLCGIRSAAAWKAVRGTLYACARAVLSASTRGRGPYPKYRYKRTVLLPVLHVLCTK